VPTRERLESDMIKTFTMSKKLTRKRRERLGNGTGMVDLSIYDGRPIFFMNEVANIGIRIRVHENLGRLGVLMSCRNSDSTGLQEGLKLCTK
jgi:hypothetical protein